jgi:hypothetical protein
MVSIDSFLPRVLPYVIGCSEPLARQAILDSSIDLCETTLVLRQALDTFSTIKNISNYDLETPNNQLKVTRVLSVTIDGREIQGLLQEDIPLLDDRVAQPSCFYTTRVDSEFTLNLHPIPDQKYKVVITVALAPRITATSLEDELFTEWTQPVIDGALARISRIPNMPFTDFNLSMSYQQAALRGMMKAKTESYYGRIRGGSRVKPRPLVR